MSGDMKIEFGSWNTAAATFDKVSAAAPPKLTQVVTKTTNAAACGAASGYATVDGAVAIMLTVFGEVMNGTVVPSLEKGLDAEATALTDTGKTLQAMEDENTDTADAVKGEL